MRPHARPYLTLDIFALRKYANLGEVRETVRWKDNGNEQSNEYVERIMEKLENARFPLYHYDNRKSIELWPSEYFEIGELRPLKRCDFGHLCLSRPARPLRCLERRRGGARSETNRKSAKAHDELTPSGHCSYGSDCFKEWKYADSHVSHSKELAKRVEEIGIIPGSMGAIKRATTPRFVTANIGDRILGFGTRNVRIRGLRGRRNGTKSTRGRGTNGLGSA